MTLTTPEAPCRQIDPVRASDLRRKRPREVTEAVLRAARFASREERRLVEAVYRDGMSACQLAWLKGERPFTMRRRLGRIVRRLLSEEFRFVLERIDEWPPSRQRVARACFLEGRTRTEACRKLRMSMHCVRRHVDIIRGLLEAER